MLLAKIKDKLFNRRNKIEIDDVEVKGDIPASIKALIESLGGIQFNKYYIYDDGVKIVDNIPEDYNGLAWIFEFIDEWDMSLFIYYCESGSILYRTFFSEYGIEIGDVELTKDGVNKLNFAQLTHSFNELDPTLKALVESAITDNWTDGVACSDAQWSAIKSLLDNSLYIYYLGVSLIKTYTNGVSSYSFGIIGTQLGMSLEISFDHNLLMIKYSEI